MTTIVLSSVSEDYFINFVQSSTLVWNSCLFTFWKNRSCYHLCSFLGYRPPLPATTVAGNLLKNVTYANNSNWIHILTEIIQLNSSKAGCRVWIALPTMSWITLFVSSDEFMKLVGCLAKSAIEVGSNFATVSTFNLSNESCGGMIWMRSSWDDWIEFYYIWLTDTVSWNYKLVTRILFHGFCMISSQDLD